MINLSKIGWENGTLVSKAKVEIGGTIYEVEPEEYSGATPLSAENLEQMETNTENAINEVDTKHTKTTLWTNSSPTSEFAGQTITLSSSDYDYVMLYYARTPGSRNEVFCNILEKNKDTELLYLDYFGNATRTWSRSAYIRNGTSVTFGACTINGSTTNTGLVPQKIIGCKY